MGCARLLACNFTKSNTPPWVFFTLLKLYKWYQIVQNVTMQTSDIILEISKVEVPSNILLSFYNLCNKNLDRDQHKSSATLLIYYSNRCNCTWLAYAR